MSPNKCLLSALVLSVISVESASADCFCLSGYYGYYHDKDGVKHDIAKTDTVTGCNVSASESACTMKCEIKDASGNVLHTEKCTYAKYRIWCAEGDGGKPDQDTCYSVLSELFKGVKNSEHGGQAPISSTQGDFE